MHPVTGSELDVRSELPEDLVRALAAGRPGWTAVLAVAAAACGCGSGAHPHAAGAVGLREDRLGKGAGLTGVGCGKAAKR